MQRGRWISPLFADPVDSLDKSPPNNDCNMLMMCLCACGGVRTASKDSSLSPIHVLGVFFPVVVVAAAAAAAEFC